MEPDDGEPLRLLARRGALGTRLGHAAGTAHTCSRSLSPSRASLTPPLLPPQVRGRPLSQLAAFRTAGDGSMRGTTAAELVDRTLCGEASLAIDVPLHAHAAHTQQLVSAGDTHTHTPLPPPPLCHLHSPPPPPSAADARRADERQRRRRLRRRRHLSTARARVSRLGAARLHASREAKGQFLASVGHELRTPLSGVLGSIELAISRPMGPELKAPLATASASAKHLMAVLESMLTLSALEVRTRAPDPTTDPARCSHIPDPSHPPTLSHPPTHPRRARSERAPALRRAGDAPRRRRRRPSARRGEGRQVQS